VLGKKMPPMRRKMGTFYFLARHKDIGTPFGSVDSAFSITSKWVFFSP
jgi:hypothetical protein